jgi:hypothetical protein
MKKKNKFLYNLMLGTSTILIFNLLVICCTSIKPNNSFNSNYLGSATTIPAGRDFELGGNNNGSFSTEVSNVGKTTVTVSQRKLDGELTLFGQLKSGEKRVFQFVAGSTAIFANPSSISAELGLRVIGDKNLRMGYSLE